VCEDSVCVASNRMHREHCRRVYHQVIGDRGARSPGRRSLRPGRQSPAPARLASGRRKVRRRTTAYVSRETLHAKCTNQRLCCAAPGDARRNRATRVNRSTASHSPTARPPPTTVARRMPGTSRSPLWGACDEGMPRLEATHRAPPVSRETPRLREPRLTPGETAAHRLAEDGTAHDARRLGQQPLTDHLDTGV
jgi:hypothetical protein